tara:strand:- start:887 stop:1654 length:768 start_codon:yes stop_codon:yes gene_type:complete
MFKISKLLRNLSRSIRTNYYFINNKKISLHHLGYGQLSNERAIEMKNLLKQQINLFKKSDREIFIFLEIGSYLGESLETYGKILSEELKDNYLMFSVDPYGLYLNKSMNMIYMYFINNISKTKFKNNFTHLRMESKKGYDLLNKLNIKLDFCYVDGSHYYKDIKFEIENFNKILVNNSEYKGFICGDDCEISYEDLIKKVDKKKIEELFSNVDNYDFIKNFDNQSINFHPGVTLAIKESELPIKITSSGFWYKFF